MSVKAYGGGGLSALAAMSAENVCFFGRLPLLILIQPSLYWTIVDNIYPSTFEKTNKTEISKSKVSLFSNETTTIYATVYCTR